MKWSRLKDMACPKEGCGRSLNQNWGKKGYECTNRECGFFIPEAKFNSTIESLYKVGQRVAELRDNLHEINNF